MSELLLYTEAMESLKKHEGTVLTGSTEQDIQSCFKKPITVWEVKAARLEDFPHQGWSQDIRIHIEPKNPNEPNEGLKCFHVGTIFLKKINSECVGEIEEIVLYPLANRFMANHQ